MPYQQGMCGFAGFAIFLTWPPGVVNGSQSRYMTAVNVDYLTHYFIPIGSYPVDIYLIQFNFRFDSSATTPLKNNQILYSSKESFCRKKLFSRSYRASKVGHIPYASITRRVFRINGISVEAGLGKFKLVDM